MPEVKKRKTRIYEPWGYREEDNYESSAGIFENLLEKFFTSVKYDEENNKIIFGNKDEEDIASLDLSGLTPSGGTVYTFNNGLQENEGSVSVLIDSESEPYITTSDNGVKISGINCAITNVETELQTAITTEENRAKAKENELDEKIDITASGLSKAIESLVEKLGYKDNDTLVTTNEHEVAFGEYNISNTDIETSGQTIFSIGNGVSNENRSNAVEVRKNGDVYLLIEGEMMNINLLLGQIAHEVY